MFSRLTEYSSLVSFWILTLLSMWLVSVPFRHGERIGFSYLVSQKYTGDKALVKILRNSKVHEFNIKLATHKRLIPAHIGNNPPSYYIIAGFVFTTVSVPYLRSEVRPWNRLIYGCFSYDRVYALLPIVFIEFLYVNSLNFSVRKRLWFWCSSKAIGQTSTCHGAICWWATRCCFSG